MAKSKRQLQLLEAQRKGAAAVRGTKRKNKVKEMPYVNILLPPESQPAKRHSPIKRYSDEFVECQTESKRAKQSIRTLEKAFEDEDLRVVDASEPSIADDVLDEIVLGPSTQDATTALEDAHPEEPSWDAPANTSEDTNMNGPLVNRAEDVSGENPEETQDVSLDGSEKRCSKRARAQQKEDLSALTEEEMRTFAIVDLMMAKAVSGKKRLPKGIKDKIKERYNLAITKRQLDNLRARFERKQSLARKKGSGRTAKYKTIQVKQWIEDTIKQSGGCILRRVFATKFKRQFGGSYGTLCCLLKSMGYRSVVRKILPILSDEHKQRRLEWCQEHVNNPQPFGDEDTVYVCVDEKWFRLMPLRKRVLMKLGDPHPYLRARSKRHITQQMYLGALAYPRPSQAFNGCIGMYLVAEKVVAKRTSKHHKSGEEYLKSITMNTKKFIQMITEQVIPDIIAQTRCWVKTIKIQMDNAGGHGGGCGKISKTIDKLNAWVAENQQKLSQMMGSRNAVVPKFEFIGQPANSPDLNVLDLGAWTSIDCRVQNRVSELRNKHEWKEAIRKSVKLAWESWSTENICSRLFETQLAVMKRIIECGGDNTYKLPHFRESKRKRAATRAQQLTFQCGSEI